MTATKWIPEGFRTVTPYLVVKGAANLTEFLQRAFHAELKGQWKRDDGTIMHSQLRIGDSALELADGGGAYPPSPGSLHIYVADVDATYRRAVEAGAVSLRAPANQPYGDRDASIQDPSGNQWYIGTCLTPGKPIPDGLHTINPYFHVLNASGFIAWLQQAFGAVELSRHAGPAGTVIHAQVRIGDSVVEISEAHGPWQPLPYHLHLYFPDVDAVYRRAMDAGSTSLEAPNDKPYGDRSAGLKDAWGNQWSLATRLKDMS